MDVLATLDTLMLEAGDTACSSPDIIEAISDLAAALADALLAQHAGLRQVDGFLYPEAEDKRARRISQSLHVAWRRWADDAALLLDRLHRLAKMGARSDHLTELADAHGRAMALLSMTPERVDRARDQVKRGELISIEEVRRGLRVGAHG